MREHCIRKILQQGMHNTSLFQVIIQYQCFFIRIKPCHYLAAWEIFPLMTSLEHKMVTYLPNFLHLMSISRWMTGCIISSSWLNWTITDIYKLKKNDIRNNQSLFDLRKNWLLLFVVFSSLGSLSMILTAVLYHIVNLIYCRWLNPIHPIKYDPKLLTNHLSTILLFCTL